MFLPFVVRFRYANFRVVLRGRLEYLIANLKTVCFSRLEFLPFVLRSLVIVSIPD
jgi:hypothetical protein